MKNENILKLISSPISEDRVMGVVLLLQSSNVEILEFFKTYGIKASFSEENEYFLYNLPRLDKYDEPVYYHNNHWYICILNNHLDLDSKRNYDFWNEERSFNAICIYE